MSQSVFELAKQLLNAVTEVQKMREVISLCIATLGQTPEELNRAAALAGAIAATPGLSDLWEQDKTVADEMVRLLPIVIEYSALLVQQYGDKLREPGVIRITESYFNTRLACQPE